MRNLAAVPPRHWVQTTVRFEGPCCAKPSLQTCTALAAVERLHGWHGPPVRGASRVDPAMRPAVQTAAMRLTLPTSALPPCLQCQRKEAPPKLPRAKEKAAPQARSGLPGV